MVDLLTLSVGLGLAISLLFSEMFALAAGGMIVPGYLALSLTRPLDVLLTVGAGLATFGIVRGLSSFIIVYGRRRTVLMILVGYVIGTIFKMTLGTMPGPSGEEIQVIGYIIPGLMAIWLDRQGAVETLAAMITASVVVRLLLIALVGLEFGA